MAHNLLQIDGEHPEDCDFFCPPGQVSTETTRECQLIATSVPRKDALDSDVFEVSGLWLLDGFEIYRNGNEIVFQLLNGSHSCISLLCHSRVQFPSPATHQSSMREPLMALTSTHGLQKRWRRLPGATSGTAVSPWKVEIETKVNAAFSGACKGASVCAVLCPATHSHPIRSNPVSAFYADISAVDDLGKRDSPKPNERFSDELSRYPAF